MPLLVVLHGKGVDHNAWFDLTPVKTIADRYGYLVAAPNGRGDRYYSGEGEQDVLDVIDDVCALFRIDPDRIYLAGHSMGGWGTWYIGLRHADCFAAIAPMAAVAPPPDWLPNARHLAPFILHDVGDPVVPVAESRRPAARLAELGVSIQYREESGYGHRSAMIGDNLPKVLEWFDEHPRVRDPRRVTFVAPCGAPSRAYWIAAIEPADASAPASIDARLENPERLAIEVEHASRIEIELESLPADCGDVLEIVVNGGTLGRVPRRGCAALATSDGASWLVAPPAP